MIEGLVFDPWGFTLGISKNFQTIFYFSLGALFTRFTHNFFMTAEVFHKYVEKIIIIFSWGQDAFDTMPRFTLRFPYK